jgi:hypothetical protein
MNTNVHLLYLTEHFLQWEMFQSCKKKIRHFTASISQNLDINEIRWKNMLQSDSPHMTV